MPCIVATVDSSHVLSEVFRPGGLLLNASILLKLLLFYSSFSMCGLVSLAAAINTACVASESCSCY